MILYVLYYYVYNSETIPASRQILGIAVRWGNEFHAFLSNIASEVMPVLMNTRSMGYMVLTVAHDACYDACCDDMPSRSYGFRAHLYKLLSKLCR